MHVNASQTILGLWAFPLTEDKVGKEEREQETLHKRRMGSYKLQKLAGPVLCAPAARSPAPEPPALSDPGEAGLQQGCLLSYIWPRTLLDGSSFCPETCWPGEESGGREWEILATAHCGHLFSLFGNHVCCFL